MISPIPLATEEQLAEICNLNKPRPNGVLLFKHSPRCVISKMALRELINDWHYNTEEIEIFLVDVINQRKLSMQIADIYGVRHESPQLLHIKENECVGNASHGSVSIQTVESWLHG